MGVFVDGATGATGVMVIDLCLRGPIVCLAGAMGAAVGATGAGVLRLRWLSTGLVGATGAAVVGATGV